jgi:beta-lactamase regulating signal transducer with metallopeptidase domain
VFLRLVLPDLPVPGWNWNLSRVIPDTESVRETEVATVPLLSADSSSLLASEVPQSGMKTEPMAVDQQPLMAKNSVPPVTTAQSLSIWGVLGLIWLAGAFLWWAALAAGWWRFRRHVLANCTPATTRAREMLAACMSEMGMRARVELKCSAHIATPAVCGVMRHQILLPDSLEPAISREDLRLLLLHELGHVKRHDSGVQLLASVLLGLHWWNPFVWLAWSQLRHEAEAATDAWVLQRTGEKSASSYGAMLLTLASRACAAGVAMALVPSLINATSKGRRLKRRILDIAAHQVARRWAVVPGVAAVACLVMAGFAEETAPKGGPETKPTAKESGTVITLKITSATTGRPLSLPTIEAGMVLRQSPERLPGVWSSTIYGASLQADPGVGEYRFEMSPKSQTQLLKFRVRCEGSAPAMTATVDPKESTTLAVALQERKLTPLTVIEEDGSPAAKARVVVVWKPLLPTTTASAEASNFSRAVRLFPGVGNSEFNDFSGDDGRCVLPPCADEASVLVVGETGYASVAYAELMKSGSMRLLPYSNVSEKKLMQRLLPPPPGAPPNGRLNVRVVYEGKPVLADRVHLLSVGDQADDLAGGYSDTSKSGLVQRSFPAGLRTLQIGWRTRDGVNCFSPVISTQVLSGEAMEVTATMKPGIRLAGHMPDEMPRPVKNARIFVFISAGVERALGKLTWNDVQPLREDGSFEFPSLPPGHMRFLVLADDWISPLKPEEKGDRHGLWSAGLITESRDDFVIPMLLTSTCEITVLDAGGKPAAGAAVTKSLGISTDGFYTRVLFFDGGHGFMLGPPPTLKDTLSELIPRREVIPVERIRNFTDAQGHVTLRGLPPLDDLGKIMIIAPGVDLLHVRNASASVPLGPLKPGETVKLAVTLRK